MATRSASARAANIGDASARADGTSCSSSRNVRRSSHATAGDHDVDIQCHCTQLYRPRRGSQDALPAAVKSPFPVLTKFRVRQRHENPHRTAQRRPLGLSLDVLILAIILLGLVVGAAKQLVLGRSGPGIDWGSPSPPVSSARSSADCSAASSPVTASDQAERADRLVHRRVDRHGPLALVAEPACSGTGQSRSRTR